MLRIGVDMLDVARVQQTMLRHGERFYTRFFTENERQQCEGQPQRLAVRIAAKEAVAKALGTGIGAVSWVEIEIEGDQRGRPSLRLHGNAARLAAALGLTAWEVSLSHTADQVIAFVVATSAP